MLEAARRGKFEVLLVWKLDRLGRSLQHLLKTLDELAGWGVEFLSLKDAGIDTSLRLFLVHSQALRTPVPSEKRIKFL